MKSIKSVFSVALVVVISMLLAYEFSQAAAEKEIMAARIGVVNVRDVAEKCDVRVRLEKKLLQEGEKVREEIQKLEQEIESDKTALSTRKQGSSDYAEMARGVMVKMATLDAQNEFYQQEFTNKQIRGEEQLYRIVLEAVKKVAQAKGLDMVFSADDNYLTAAEPSDEPTNPSDFMLTVRTHKLLYSAKQIDITDEVVSEMAGK